METVRFFSRENPYLYLAFRLLPGYPITSETIKNSGITFRNGEYVTSDEKEIAGLRNFIIARSNCLTQCPIYEEGNDIDKRMTALEWTLEAERQEEVKRREEEEQERLREIRRLLRL